MGGFKRGVMKIIREGLKFGKQRKSRIFFLMIIIINIIILITLYFIEKKMNDHLTTLQGKSKLSRTIQNKIHVGIKVHSLAYPQN